MATSLSAISDLGSYNYGVNSNNTAKLTQLINNELQIEVSQLTNNTYISLKLDFSELISIIKSYIDTEIDNHIRALSATIVAELLQQNLIMNSIRTAYIAADNRLRDEYREADDALSGAADNKFILLNNEQRTITTEHPLKINLTGSNNTFSITKNNADRLVINNNECKLLAPNAQLTVKLPFSIYATDNINVYTKDQTLNLKEAGIELNATGIELNATGIKLDSGNLPVVVTNTGGEYKYSNIINAVATAALWN